MSTLAENIKRYRKQAGFTQKELASKLGIAPTAVSAWELGRNKPLMDNVEQMSVIFDVKKSELLGEDLIALYTNPKVEVIPSTLQKITTASSQLEHKRQLTVLEVATEQLEEQNTVTDSKNTVNELQATYHTYNYYDQPASAGTGQYLNDVKVETIELPIEVDADFVVPIYGDSMEPEYHSGDYIFVKLSVDLSDGDIGVFAYNGEAYIKQLRITDQGAYLHSLNPDYDNIPITADTDFRTIGEVVDIYRG
ncbi:XRE family transcriptional regulator [Streptococcus suis]|uniref:XRE family transcriptional regulator n=1 Tax=Streptococcus suis TaxID=1307 RepID=UPI0021186789|nr:XRE family transcriptional regulator [Streptococcus suis]MCQ8272845.1 XRE family transcriptional regulator [Streptococcus suis]MDY7599892.1 XRE family transcriptional regulator [Streptococcus suis]UUM50421.1 XRE family transcriptional regulator [Streptococcus suis]HEL1769674.1 helix-turn-helix transcriptional regulator [Streptococcus suis]HEL1782337.1 helix-turn-helix transcriptional regulator [Streptococcus suis]